MKTRKIVWLLLLLLAMSLIVVACGGDEEAPADEADEGDGADVAEEEEEAVACEDLTFWSTEVQPERAAATEEILAAFTDATGIEAELVLAGEDNLPSLVTSSVAAGTLPDVIFLPLDFVAGYVEQGVLDAGAATAMIEELGADTFAQGALELVELDGEYGGIPSDGWGQLLIYRKDLFDAAGLETPDSFERIEAAAAALNDPSNSFYGITAANDPSAVFTQQTFEQFALANSCELIADDAVALDSPECVEAIDFFTNLLSNYSPAGVQDVVSTRATYFSGQAAMIIWSPFILDEMAGLRDEAFPACPECVDNTAYLAENSAIVPAFIGPSGAAPAQYGQVSYLSISSDACMQGAEEFVRFWFDEAYLDWLALAPEGKFPMRRGTAANPEEFIEGWSALDVGVDRREPLSANYGDEVINTLVEGAANFQRWGFGKGGGPLVAAVYESLAVPQALSDVLDGSLTPEAAAQEMAAEVEDLR